jgi:hypothetical protein
MNFACSSRQEVMVGDENLCGEEMKLGRSGEVSAVLKAADEWVSALETLVAAKGSGGEADAEREVLDIAGSQLVVAVMRWRSISDLG